MKPRAKIRPMAKVTPLLYDVFICAECARKSGQGEWISVTYRNTGGYLPAWSGRHCEHLTADEILQYLRKDANRG